jgi:hypothetical protein
MYCWDKAKNTYTAYSIKRVQEDIPAEARMQIAMKELGMPDTKRT